MTKLSYLSVRHAWHGAAGVLENPDDPNIITGQPKGTDNPDRIIAIENECLSEIGHPLRKATYWK